MVKNARFGNLILVGDRSQELARAATKFSKTSLGKAVGEMGAAAGREAKRMLPDFPLKKRNMRKS